MTPHHVFVTGGTGYVGYPLITELVRRGHSVRALVRPGSERRLPARAEALRGDALDSRAWSTSVAPADTLVHLVGTPHPNPSKAREFQRVDLASVRASVDAARTGRVAHFIYVSVAHPAPVMHAYIAVRREGETMIRESGLPATILRPWYVLGPGHRWPYLLLPLYAVLSRLPSAAESARRLGLVTRAQMVGALVRAVEHPPAAGITIVGVPEIRASLRAPSPPAP